MRTRKNDWLDLDCRSVLLGIDISTDGKSWSFYCENKEVWYGSSEEEREYKRKEIRKL